MLFFRKFFKLPTPVDLGWSKYNALEMEEFQHEHSTGKTWQDWHRTVKAMHPVKYFLAETLTNFIYYKLWLTLWRPCKDAHYWFVSHFVPSRRYHMLDLRQPEGYRYGWQDVPEKMLYAMFNLLGQYLKHEDPVDLTQYYSLAQIEADDILNKQHSSLQEARAIYYWWTVQRKKDMEISDKLMDELGRARKNKLPQRHILSDKLIAHERYMENKTEEMVLRLMRIRNTLWT